MVLRKTAIAAAASLATLGALTPPSALAQSEQRIEITGSAIKRIDAEAALPVQIMTREDIQRTSATTVEQLMQTISAASSSGGLTTSSASGATTGGISAISLRGLTSLRTLVLVNGRRIAPYGIGFTNDSVSVDVNSIPLAAVERVEILKEGASSLYGSDAIAGVVNFILRKDLVGGDITVEYGSPAESRHGDQKRVSLAWGTGDMATNRYQLMIVGTFQKESALFGRDRSFARSSSNVDELNSTTSGNTFPANIAAVDGSFGSRNPTAPSGCVMPYSQLVPELFGSNACRFDPAPMVTLLPETERAGVFVTGRLALGNDWEAFGEASFTRGKSRTVIQPVPISDQFTIPPNHPLANTAPYNTYTAQPSSTIILSSTSAYYPTAYVQGITGGATPDLFVRYRAGVSGNRDLTDISEAPRVMFGVRGGMGGWDMDAAFLHSSSKVTEQVNDGFPLYSKILPLLNSGTVNFFGDNTPAVLQQIRAANFTGDAFSVTSSLTSLTGKVSKELAQLSGGGVGLALGAEARQEKYKFDSSTQLQQGDVSGYGGNIARVDRERNVASVFAEVNLPVLKTLEFTGSARYDHYEGVGSSTTPKASFRWQPVKSLVVRGSAGKGFRAPSLADLYTPDTVGVSQTGLTDPLRCPTTDDGVKDCATQFTTANGGNAKLKPEKSTNYTLGIVVEPVNDLSLTLDAFKIRLTDTIQPLAQGFILANLDKYSAFVTRGPVDPAFPNLPGPIQSIDQHNLNIGETRLMGYDVDLRYRTPAAAWGRLAFAFSGTYFSKYDVQNPDGSFSSTVGNLSNSSSGGVVPRWKTYQSVTWNSGPWAATLAMNWQAHYWDVPGNFMDPVEDPDNYRIRRVGSYETWDLQASYSAPKGLRVAVGVRNLFDRDPPYTNQGFSFQSGYDPQYADPRGRFVYVRAGYSF